jgi:RNA-binding protein YhbY
MKELNEQEHTFLGKLKEMANYDENKSIKKIDIVEAIGMKGYSNEVIDQIVQTLISEGLVKPGNREDEVKITYEWKHKKSKS